MASLFLTIAIDLHLESQKHCLETKLQPSFKVGVLLADARCWRGQLWQPHFRRVHSSSDLINNATLVVGHGMKQDLRWLKGIGIELPCNPGLSGAPSDYRVIDTQTVVVAKTNNPQNVRNEMFFLCFGSV